MVTEEEIQSRARYAATLRALENDVRQGHKYKEAKALLEAAEARGETGPHIGMLRFAVAFYAPLTDMQFDHIDKPKGDSNNG